MKIVFYLDCVSPHQVPLAREVVKRVGADNFRYVYHDAVQEDRAALGWQMSGDAGWFVHIGTHPDVAQKWIETADVMLTGFRDFELLERRKMNGLMTFYMSERWFKPIGVSCWRWRVYLPGHWRLLSNRYRQMARRLVTIAKRDARFRYLAMGAHAQNDILKIGLPPAQIVPWAYYVAPSESPRQWLCEGGPLRVIWLGRMIDWKHPESVVKAARRCQSLGVDVTFTMVGDGPLRKKLMHEAAGLPITFLPPQPIGRIREILRAHDVYVLASDASEGWGAALNEALEEGLHALGTYEAGSSITMLHEHDLFHAGDCRNLTSLLERFANEKSAGTLTGQGVGEWSAEKAAERFLSLINDVGNGFCETR